MKEQAKLVLKTIISIIILLIASILVGFGLIFLAFHIPVNQQIKNKAVELQWEQNESADYPTLASGQEYFGSYRPGVFDGGTVNGVILRITFKNIGDNFIKESMIPEYSYYWHGYISVLRPILFFLEYKELEIINSFILIVMAIIICMEIARRKNRSYALLFASTFLLIFPMIVGVCLQYIPIAFVSYLGVMFVLFRQKFLAKNNNLLLFFVTLGILTAYFDLLTFPLLTWGLPILWWVILENDDKKEIKYLVEVITSGISWCIGYVGMWAGKWILGSIILRNNVIFSALSEIRYRSGENGEFALRNRYYSLYQNWRHYTFIGYVILFSIWIVIWLILTVKKGWSISKKAFALALIALSSIAWYAVCSEHTFIHHFFTYRIYNVLLGAIGAIILESLSRDGETLIKSQRRFKHISVIVMCAIISLGFTYFTYEEGEVTNKWYPGFESQFVDGSSMHLEMNYHPSYKKAVGACIALKSDCDSGYYDLKLLDDNQIIYEEHIPSSMYNYYHYDMFPIDWKLEPGKTYRLTVDAVDIDSQIQLYTNDLKPEIFSEISDCKINGVNSDQFCAGITYWTRPFSKTRKLFLWATWFSVLMVISYLGMHMINHLRDKHKAN